MAVFLLLDGIKGESTNERHRDEIEVTAWSFGVTNSGASHMGGGAGSAKATFSDLAVTKRFDKATPALLRSAATAQHLRSGRLSVVTGGEHPIDAIVVELGDVLVTSCLLAASPDDPRPVESVALSFGTVRVRYAQQSPTGQVGDPVEFAWDVVHNRPL